MCWSHDFMISGSAGLNASYVYKLQPISKFIVLTDTEIYPRIQYLMQFEAIYNVY